MLSGYGIIACPLVLTAQSGDRPAGMIDAPCPRCLRTNHAPDANFCRICGTALLTMAAAVAGDQRSKPKSPRRRLVRLKKQKPEVERKLVSTEKSSSDYDEIPL